MGHLATRRPVAMITSPTACWPNIFFTARTPGLNRSMNPTSNFTPAFFADLTSFSAERSSPVIGFSTRRCLPASIADNPTFRWVFVGVQTVTESTLGTRRNLLRSAYHWTPYLLPISFARLSSFSQTATSSAIRLWRRIRTWFSPQKPVPITPTPTRFIRRECLFLWSYRRGRPSQHLKLPEL